MLPASLASYLLLAERIFVEEQGLAVVDVTHDGDDRRPRALGILVVGVLVVEVLELELGFLLLAGVDQSHDGADLGGEQLDHVVGQAHGGGDHLALLEQEADHVGGRAVQLGPDVLGRHAPLEDDLTFGHRARHCGGRVPGELLGLQLLEGAPAAAPAPALRRPTTTPGSARTSPTRQGRRASPPPPPGRGAEASTRPGAESAPRSSTATGAAGPRGAAAGEATRPW